MSSFYRRCVTGRLQKSEFLVNEPNPGANAPLANEISCGNKVLPGNCACKEVSRSAFNRKTDHKAATIPKINSLRNWMRLAMRAWSDSITVTFPVSATVVMAFCGWMRLIVQPSMQFWRCSQLSAAFSKPS
jgi:hypothetical protein